MMNIYTYLKRDHQLVADLMNEVLSADAEQRRSLFEKIKQELALHADTEELTFYQAIEHATRSRDVHEKMGHADDEHDEIRDYLETLSKLDVRDEKWIEQFGELRHAVSHHVEEEEGDIFDKAKKYLTDKQAKQLAIDMEALKHQRMGMRQSAA